MKKIINRLSIVLGFITFEIIGKAIVKMCRFIDTDNTNTTFIRALVFSFVVVSIFTGFSSFFAIMFF